MSTLWRNSTIHAGLMAAAVWLISGCVLGAFRLPEEKLEPIELCLGQGSVFSLAYSPDGRQVASGHEFRSSWRSCEGRYVSSAPLPFPQVRLWQAHIYGTPNLNCATFTVPNYDWREPTVQFSSDARFLFATTRNGLLRWDISEQRLDKRFQGCWPVPVLSPSCGVIARCLVDEERILAQTFRFQNEDQADPSTPKRVNPEDDGNVEILDVESGTVRNVLSAKSNPGSPIAFSPDEEVLACWHAKEVVFWHLPSGMPRARIGAIEMTVWGQTFSQNWRTFAAYDGKGPVGAWDIPTGARRLSVNVGDYVRCIALSPDGKLLAIGREGLDKPREHGEIQLWDVTTGKLVKKLVDESTWGFTALCFSPEGGTLASGDGHGRIKFWPVPGVE